MISKLIIDCVKNNCSGLEITWDYKIGLSPSKRSSHVKTIGSAINWLHVNIGNLDIDKEKLICSQSVFDQILSKLSGDDQKIGKIEIIISNKIPVNKIVLTESLNPETTDKFGVIEILNFKKENVSDNYDELLKAIRELMQELRIDDVSLAIMADGFSPDHPTYGLKLDTQYKNPYCKIQITKTTAENLLKAIK